MDDTEILKRFETLWEDDLEADQYWVRKPLLAHYTSIQSLEKILRSSEIWFSNPLLMNDFEEVRFALEQGAPHVLSSNEIINACGTSARADIFQRSFTHYYQLFVNDHALDTYVFCLSEHEKDDTDGLLSMWRGYGGNGTGAAIVFDTSKLEVVETSALLLSKVHYATGQRRLTWIADKVSQFAGVLSRANVPDDKLYLTAYALFERLKIFALFSKHLGFREECEWRAVYVRSRDHDDRLKDMFDYTIGRQGVEPKLKLKVGPIDGLTGSSLSIDQVIHTLLLGPSVASPLAKAAFLRLLERLGKADLQDRVFASSIPFRPT